MIKPSSSSVLNSLKGRIWLAVSALAILNCLAGLGAYLAVSFFVSDPFITIFVTFFVLAFVTVVFGWWLSNDISRPIESVTLLARSLERNPSATLPRTTGSAETDELLLSLHRSGQQLRNLIIVMDDVAVGKVDSAFKPLEGGDRLSASFQKLVGKVTESITAKRDLDAIQSALASISSDIAGVRNGKLDVQIRSEHPQTKEIVEAVRYLSNKLGDLALQVRSSTFQCEEAASNARSILQSAIARCDERSSIFPRSMLLDASDVSRRGAGLISELSNKIENAEHIRETILVAGSAKPAEKAAQIRAHVSDTAKKVQKLRDRAQAYTQLSRTARDLSKRSNLIALNASLGDKSNSSAVGLVAGELSLLSEKAERLFREISESNEGLNGEIAELEKDFAALSKEAPDFAKLLSASVNANLEFASLLEELSELKEQLKVVSQEQSGESEKIAEVIESVADTTSTTALIRESESSLRALSAITENLKDSIGDISLPPGKVRIPQSYHRPVVTEPATFESVTGLIENKGEDQL